MKMPGGSPPAAGRPGDRARLSARRFALTAVCLLLLVVLFLVVMEFLALVIRLTTGLVAFGALFGFLVLAVAVIVATAVVAEYLKRGEARGLLPYRFAVCASVLGLMLFGVVALRALVLMRAGLPTIAGALGPVYLAAGGGGLAFGIVFLVTAIVRPRSEARPVSSRRSPTAAPGSPGPSGSRSRGPS